jgi:hypothetical protein
MSVVYLINVCCDHRGCGKDYVWNTDDPSELHARNQARQRGWLCLAAEGRDLCPKHATPSGEAT